MIFKTTLWCWPFVGKIRNRSYYVAILYARVLPHSHQTNAGMVHSNWTLADSSTGSLSPTHRSVRERCLKAKFETTNPFNTKIKRKQNENINTYKGFHNCPACVPEGKTGRWSCDAVKDASTVFYISL